MVNGSMEEAQTGCVTWEDVDEDTFARFAQFAYTGDYSPASHELHETNITPAVEPEHGSQQSPEEPDSIRKPPLGFGSYGHADVGLWDDSSGFGDWAGSKKGKKKKAIESNKR